MAKVEEDDQNAIPYKLVLLGESAVGKSSLVLRFCRGEFWDNHESTIGAAFLAQIVKIPDAVIKFEIWDTAGQERFRSLTPMYYRGASAAIVVYSIISYDSFVKAKSWIKELQKQENKDIIICLAGNKCDLTSERKVDTEEAKAYALEKGIMFFETSAKAQININEMFEALAKKMPKDKPVDKDGKEEKTDKITTLQTAKPKNEGCCKKN